MSDERRLAESLQRRAAGFSPQQAGMDQVVARARTIRRRRRTAVSALAAAAVAAVAIPTGLTLGSGPDAGTPVVPAASHSPSPSATPSATPSPSPAAPATTPSSPPTPSLTLDRIKRGGSIGIGWLEGSTWHGGQGGTMTLPAGSYLAITPYRGGFLVTSPHDSGGQLSGAVATVSWLDNGMNPQWTACGSGALVVSGDHMLAAYSKLSGCTASAADTLHSGISSSMANSETVRPVPGGHLAEPIGQTDQVLVYNLIGLTDGSQLGAWYTNLAQQQPAKQIPGLAYATAVNTSRQQVAGASASQLNAGVVVDPVTGKVVWQVQDWFPGQFSPDGKYVVAAHSAGGHEPDAYAILDASTGSFVQRLDLSKYGMQVAATAWNPDDSLLLLVHQGDRQAVLRLTPQGQFTRVSRVLPADPAHAVVFETQP